MVTTSKPGRNRRLSKKSRVRISKSGQITLPAKIRKKLNVKPGEFVDIIEDSDGTVTVNRAKILTVDEIAGMAKPLPPGEDLEDVLREARSGGSVRERYRTGSLYNDPD